MGYTHAELSKLAGVGRRTLDRIAANRCSPSHGVLLSLMVPLGYPRSVADALYRRSFTDPSELDALCPGYREDGPALTGEELMAILAAMTPEERRHPLKGAATGALIVGVRVSPGALLVEARMA